MNVESGGKMQKTNAALGGKMQKTNAALGGKMQKTPFSSEKTAFFTLKKNEAN